MTRNLLGIVKGPPGGLGEDDHRRADRRLTSGYVLTHLVGTA